ncbi:MAG TPA: ribosome-binding factor A, partial [Actinopolymorphaceae bacterium]
MNQTRVNQIADRIREIVAALLERRVKDPRLGFVTVTGVRLTPDLRDATVYYTVLGDGEARTSSAAALES